MTTFPDRMGSDGISGGSGDPSGPDGGKACPSCGEPLHFNLVAHVKNTSRVQFKLCPAPGELLSAATVGGSVEAMAKLICASGSGVKFPVETLVEKITTDADGAITVDLIICRFDVAEQIRKRRKARKAAAS